MSLQDRLFADMAAAAKNGAGIDRTSSCVSSPKRLASACAIPRAPTKTAFAGADCKTGKKSSTDVKSGTSAPSASAPSSPRISIGISMPGPVSIPSRTTRPNSGMAGDTIIGRPRNASSSAAILPFIRESIFFRTCIPAGMSASTCAMRRRASSDEISRDRVETDTTPPSIVRACPKSSGRVATQTPPTTPQNGAAASSAPVRSSAIMASFPIDRYCQKICKSVKFICYFSMLFGK